MDDGLSIGPLLLRWSGFLFALGVLAGAFVSTREAKHREYDPEIIYYLFLPLLIGGTVGARIWYILTPPLSSVQLGLTTQYYLSHPVDAISVWLGGFGIPGALMGVLVALVFFARRNGSPFWEITDILAPGLALAQAIGRLGDYFSQQLYGPPTILPWKMFVDPAYRLPGFVSANFFQPLFAYEVILNFANMIFLLWISRRHAQWLKAGDLFLVYLGIYSAGRFFLEYLRLDVALVAGININQVFFILLLAGTGVGLALRHRAAKEL
jgi:phosphatidylglycerol---prolipoprotein diacylglyceryl transferase